MRCGAALRVVRGLSTDAAGLKLFRGNAADKRQQRTAANIREALSAAFARGAIKDHRLEHGAAIHVVDVEVAKGGGVARVLWEPSDERRSEDARALRTLQAALEKKAGLLRAHVNSYLRLKRAVALEFVPLRSALGQRTQAATAFVANQRRALDEISEQLRHADEGSPD